MGYFLAGFRIVGVDIKPQPRYPFEFIQADAMTYPLGGFDAIHASPPCEHYSRITGVNGIRSEHPALIVPIRERLSSIDAPWVMENVADAPLVNYIQLCGSSFGLNIQRHRLFESGGWQPGLVPPCAHHWQRRRFRSLNKHGRLEGKLSPVVGVYGSVNYAGEFPIRCAVIEVKTTHADFMADKVKPHRSADSGLGDRRYFMCPRGVIERAEIPEGWGLLYATAYRVNIEVNATARPDSARRDRLEKRMCIDLLHRVYQRGFEDVVRLPWEEYMTWDLNSPHRRLKRLRDEQQIALEAAALGEGTR